jgi:hypothetical protein
LAGISRSGIVAAEKLPSGFIRTANAGWRISGKGSGEAGKSGGAASRKDSLSGMQPRFRARLEAMFHDAPEGSSVFRAIDRRRYNPCFSIGRIAPDMSRVQVIRITGCGTRLTLEEILLGFMRTPLSMGCGSL